MKMVPRTLFDVNEDDLEMVLCKLRWDPMKWFGGNEDGPHENV